MATKIADKARQFYRTEGREVDNRERISQITISEISCNSFQRARHCVALQRKVVLFMCVNQHGLNLSSTKHCFLNEIQRNG